MSKINLNDLATLTDEQSAITSINQNWSEIESKSDLFLSRDGTSPNTMNANLDMNSNRILNLPEAASASEPVRLQEFETVLADILSVSDSVAEAAASAAQAASEALEAEAAADTVAVILEDAEEVLAQIQAVYDNFDDRYLGAKAADPSLDNDGNALLTGALYWNTVGNKIRVYDGVEWEDFLASAFMQASVYDPQEIEADAFDVDNHTNGTTNKVYTAVEQSKLAGIEALADVTDTANVTSAGAFMKATDDLDDLTEGTTNKHFTSTEKSKLSGIESLADVTDATNVGSSIHGASAKTTPVDADTIPLIDSAASNTLKKVTWANVKSTLNYQPLDSDLTALAGLSSSGLIARTGSGTAAVRTLTAPAAGISVSNGDGVSGNPTLALANDLSAVEGLSSTGLVRRTGTDTWSAGTTITTAEIADAQVTNAKLANMSQSTIKGRAVSAGTGVPTDLTGTQATAILDAVVGDSGAGGTKGLVPAPSAGDAAAEKFLKADGTWATPPGGVSDSARRNQLLNSICISKSLAGYLKLEDAFADGYKASDGINSGASSGYSVTTASGYWSPTSTPGTDQTATHTGDTAGGNTVSASGFFTGFPAWKAVDKVTGGTVGTGCWIVASTTTSWWQYQFGSAKTIASYTVRSGNGFATRAPGAWNLLGSNTGAFAGEEVILDTRASETAWGSGGEQRSYTIASPGSYTYYRLAFTTNNGDSTYTHIDEITLVAPATPNNVSVVTTTQTADASASNVRALLAVDPIDSITLNTDLAALVTCNGGTNWSNTTLTNVGSVNIGGLDLLLLETAITACTAGTSIAACVQSANNKNFRIYGLTTVWS